MEPDAASRPPSVDALARSLAATGLPHAICVDIARGAIDDDAVESAAARAEAFSLSLLTRVVNATGVLLHTNLGRAPFAHAQPAAAQTVEFDLLTGRRGSRQAGVGRLFALLCGADDAMVVNNNASAVLLVVAALAAGRDVPVSRGESVEIGGAFRVPDVIEQSGARLVDVGTTNRTRLSDYERAIDRSDVDAAMILKIHPSNYRVEGFVEDTPIASLAGAARLAGIPLVADIGSGLVDANCPWLPGAPPAWLAGEPAAVQSLADGADLVMFSGDKLLGGPQAGILLGGRRIIDGLRAHPMRRALRVDKTTLAALDAVLNMYLEAEGRPQIPTLDQLAQPLTQLEARAAALLQELKAEAPPGWRGQVVVGQSSVGGGSFSNVTMESRLLLWTGPKAELEACHQLLRLGNPALVGRMNQDGLAVDVRTLIEEELPLVVEAFCRAWNRLVG